MVLLDDSSNVSSLQVMKRFLSSRPDLFQQKRLIVFALTAPYYLDARYFKVDCVLLSVQQSDAIH